MRKVILWDMLTLDGRFEGPGQDLSWFVFDNDLNTPRGMSCPVGLQ